MDAGARGMWDSGDPSDSKRRFGRTFGGAPIAYRSPPRPRWSLHSRWEYAPRGDCFAGRPR
ncbi:MAG TPA: hypothetical protein VFD73_20800, partial [Gemmatimonadales bacterium]|nr:hypothetical protein [Gemmatimonadales bacterium]